jgi:flagellar hook-associated protein 1 FlgK
MSLSSALSTAMAGLRANQAALSIVSSNVANAKTPGYVTQGVNQIEVAGGPGNGAGVRINGVNRQLDQYIQAQLRTESSGGAYADQTANILSQLQSVYGTPGEAGTLETALSNLTGALQGLSASSGASSAQAAVLSAAQSLAQQLNATTTGIQALRSNIEQDIGVSVGQANVAINQIAQYNARLQGMDVTDPAAATLMDQRDNAINQLAQLMDIRVVTDNTNQANVFTNSGIQLVGGGQASQLNFNSQGTLNANAQWNANPALSGAGTITVQLPNGGSFDLIANNAIGSGQLAADIKLRDKTLVGAQAQVDQLAAVLASALSDITKSGAAVTGPPAGFDLDLSSVQPGNSINLTYTDTATNTRHQVTILRVDDPAALPLSNTATADPNDQVVGVNFSGGMASIVAQLNAALGPAHLQFSNPAGSTLRAVDDNTAAASVNAASTTTTVGSLASGVAQLPMFTDAGALYTGKITVDGPQMTGLAGRIMVNPALMSDPSKLTMYNMVPLTPSGDTTRADFIFSQLTSAQFTYSAQTGIGSAATPYKGTVSGFMQQFLSQQSNASVTATQLQQGQAVVVSTLQQKFNATSAVSIDTEMANLIALQNSYAANAHIMSVVQSMMTSLLQIQG